MWKTLMESTDSCSLQEEMSSVTSIVEAKTGCQIILYSIIVLYFKNEVKMKSSTPRLDNLCHSCIGPMYQGSELNK